MSKKIQRNNRARTRVSYQYVRKYEVKIPYIRYCYYRYCSILESLETSLQEMKLMREGKLPKKTWQEFQNELEQ